MKKTTAAEGGHKEGATDLPPKPNEKDGAVVAAPSKKSNNPADGVELEAQEEYNTSEPTVEPDGRLRPDSAAGGYSVNPEEKLDPGIERGNPAGPEDPQPTPTPTAKPSANTSTMKTMTMPAPDEDPNSDPENAAAKNNIEEVTAEEIMAKHVGEVPKAEKKFSLASLKSKSEEAVPRSNTRPGTITVGKPNDDTYVRTSTNPEERAAFDFIELKTEKKLYLLTPDVVEEINALNEDRAQIIIKTVKKRLIYSVTRLGDPFLWPITIMDDNDWIDSANTCADAAKENWIRVVSNMSARHYDYVTSPSTNEPKWPSMTYEDAVLKGFDGKIIDTMDHDVIRQLLGAG